MSDDDFIDGYIQREVNKRQENSGADRLQLHKADILKAKLPEYFKQVIEVLQRQTKRLDQGMVARGMKTSTTIDAQGNEFTCKHVHDEMYSQVKGRYEVNKQTITLKSSGDLKNIRQQFTVSVNGRDNLVIREMESIGGPSLTPQKIADEIFRLLLPS